MKLVEFNLKPHPQTFKKAKILIPLDKVQYVVSNVDENGVPEGPVLVNAMPVEENWLQVRALLGDASPFEVK